METKICKSCEETFYPTEDNKSEFCLQCLMNMDTWDEIAEADYEF